MAQDRCFYSLTSDRYLRNNKILIITSIVMNLWLNRYPIVKLNNLVVPCAGKKSKAGGRYLKKYILGMPA